MTLKLLAKLKTLFFGNPAIDEEVCSLDYSSATSSTDCSALDPLLISSLNECIAHHLKDSVSIFYRQELLASLDSSALRNTFIAQEAELLRYFKELGWVVLSLASETPSPYYLFEISAKNKESQPSSSP